VAHLWDNGSNAIDELGNVMKVRAARYDVLAKQHSRRRADGDDRGCARADLHVSPVPGRSGSKGNRGQDYTFSVKGKGDRNPQIVSPEEQRRALTVVLDTIKPDALAVPESLLRLIPPRPAGYGRTREDFRIRTQPVFDALARQKRSRITSAVSCSMLNVRRAWFSFTRATNATRVLAKLSTKYFHRHGRRLRQPVIRVRSSTLLTP
jgi:hypothetical protein